MQEFMNSQRKSWMVWAIIALILMNLATWTMILIHTRQSENTGENVANSQVGEVNAVRYSGRYFRDVLGLDESQMDSFRKFNPVFRQTARQINSGLVRLKSGMLREMSASDCDTTRLNMLSDSIGFLHAQLKRETYRYYLQFKTICKADQQQKLDLVFSDLFDLNDESANFGQNGRGRDGQGRWHGNVR